jgi:hypothetical protein
MFRRLLYASVCVQALLLGSLLVNELDRIVHHPYEEPEDVPSTPNRLQLFVAGSTNLSASVSATTSASATMSTVLANVERGQQMITDMVTGNEYPWPVADHRERPAEYFDVRSLSSWRGVATGELPVRDNMFISRSFRVTDVRSGSATS